MMTSLYGDISCITVPFVESADRRWIPLMKGPVMPTFGVFSLLTWTSFWPDSWVTGDLIYTRDVIIMFYSFYIVVNISSEYLRNCISWKLHILHKKHELTTDLAMIRSYKLANMYRVVCIF